MNEPIARIDGSAEWYLQDRMGSVRDIVNSAGAVVAHATYDAWGLVTGSSGSTDRYLAFGYQLDSESGLYYVMARYLDPVTHLFLQQDPIYADVNGYRYAGNNPTNMVDPSGQYLVVSGEEDLAYWKGKLDKAGIKYTPHRTFRNTYFLHVAESEKAKAQQIEVPFGPEGRAAVVAAVASSQTHLHVGQGKDTYITHRFTNAIDAKISNLNRARTGKEAPPDEDRPQPQQEYRRSPGDIAREEALKAQVRKDDTWFAGKASIVVLLDDYNRLCINNKDREIFRNNPDWAKVAKTQAQIFAAVGLKGAAHNYRIENEDFGVEWADGNTIQGVVIRDNRTNEIVRWGWELRNENLETYGYEFFRTEGSRETYVKWTQLIVQLGLLATGMAGNASSYTSSCSARGMFIWPTA